SMEARGGRGVEKGHKTELFEIMEAGGRDRLTSGVWAKALARDDRLAVRLVERAVAALAAGIASAINLLDLEAVVIGGGLGTRLGPAYAGQLDDAMLPHLFVPQRPPAVRVPELRGLGGAIGAPLPVPDSQHRSPPADGSE